MISSLAAALLAGLVGSPHCVGMCGGFAAACGAPSGEASGLDRAAWHLGRLTTYAVLGGLAGAFGSLIPGPTWIPTALSTVLMVAFALVLAGVVPEPRLRIPGASRLASLAFGRAGTAGRYLFGVSTGLLPCGLVYAALAVPVASGSPLVGAVSMVAFGLGTVPVLALFTRGVRSLALRELWIRRLLAAGVLVAGLVSVALRQGAMTHLHH